MQTLWSPWRSQYIQSLNDSPSEKDLGCFLCNGFSQPEHDHENLIVARREHCFVVMNRFPYNAGHLLVAPNRHVGELTLLEDSELSNIMLVIKESSEVLTSVFKSHGINIGANLGRAAGAGLPDHVHFHLVPRWNGDTNFMPIFADVKIVSESMDNIKQKLTTAFAR